MEAYGSCADSPPAVSREPGSTGMRCRRRPRKTATRQEKTRGSQFAMRGSDKSLFRRAEAGRCS
eukprot:10655222-Alexandrium_andersonii.AAC.1